MPGKRLTAALFPEARGTAPTTPADLSSLAPSKRSVARTSAAPSAAVSVTALRENERTVSPANYHVCRCNRHSQCGQGLYHRKCARGAARQHYSSHGTLTEGRRTGASCKCLCAAEAPQIPSKCGSVELSSWEVLNWPSLRQNRRNHPAAFAGS